MNTENTENLVSNVLTSNMAAVKSLDCLIGELEHYRQQSEWLTSVNDLHIRLAGAVDVPSMIEAFSIWMMPLMEHDLIAYQNPERNRMHMFCSCHGPERRRVMKAANKILNIVDGFNDTNNWREDKYYVQTLSLNTQKGQDRLVLLKYKKPIHTLDDKLLQNVLEIMNESLQRSLDYEDIFEQARHDALTGLANRRVFEERVEQLIESSRRYHHPVTMASMDLDNFKQLNDSYGHAHGDMALQKVAHTMSKMVRNSDLLVRMGGDEFVLVMQDTDLESARILAERLRKAVGKLNLQTGEKNRLGISIGLAQWQKGMSKDDWLQQADEILYQAKAEGRSRVCLVMPVQNN